MSTIPNVSIYYWLAATTRDMFRFFDSMQRSRHTPIVSLCSHLELSSQVSVILDLEPHVCLNLCLIQEVRFQTPPLPQLSKLGNSFNFNPILWQNSPGSMSSPQNPPSYRGSQLPIRDGYDRSCAIVMGIVSTRV